FRSEHDCFFFVRGKIELLRKFDHVSLTGERAAQFAVDWGRGCVGELGANGQMREIGAGQLQFGFESSVANADGTAGRKNNFLPETYVFVWGRGIPVHPSNSKFAGMRRKDFHGNGVLRARMDKIGDVKFIATECADNGVRAGKFIAVDPDVGAVVDAAESQ